MRLIFILTAFLNIAMAQSVDTDWDNWKAFYDTWGGTFGYVESSNYYHLSFQHGGLNARTDIYKGDDVTDANTNHYDFVNNYKDLSWTYYDISGELTTADSNSIVMQGTDGNDLNYATIETQDANGNDANDANAVVTIVNFEPNFDYIVMGGRMVAESKPSNDVRMWVVILPDIPSSLGGNKTVISGANFKITETVTVDLSANKRRFNYDDDNNTNKIMFKFKHSKGDQVKLLYNMQMMRKYDI